MSRRSAAETRANFENARNAANVVPELDEFNDLALPEERTGSTEKASPPSIPRRGPRRLTSTPSALDDKTPYGTGIEIDADLHDKVMKASGARRQGDVRQTEILLTAFETVYPDIPDLVRAHKNRNRVESPLFGQRTVHVTENSGPVKRLQVRPKRGEYQALTNLANEHDVPLAVLTRLVLRKYFEAPAAKRAKSRPGETAAS